MTVMSEAPNFSRNYPLGGERIGPAWRAMWAEFALRPMTWQRGDRLAEWVTQRVGVERKTSAGLLSAARRAGVLEVRYRMIESRKRAEYRIAERYR